MQSISGCGDKIIVPPACNDPVITITPGEKACMTQFTKQEIIIHNRAAESRIKKGLKNP